MPAARPSIVSSELAAYIAAHSSAPDEVQQRLQRATTARTGDAAVMQIGSDQGAFFEIFARAIGAQQALEIGTFTGYSALSIARGMGPGGRLICCDVSEEWTAIAREHWEQAGVADRIDLRIGPALDTIAELPSDLRFDLVFIDADKTGYLAYYEALVHRLSPTGVMLVDNTLWSGLVADGEHHDEATEALRVFNRTVAADARVMCALLPVGDGVTLIQRR